MESRGTERLRSAGIDLGSSLAKLVGRTDEGALVRFSIPSADDRRLQATFDRLDCDCIGLTGAGAYPWVQHFRGDATHVDEFRAWRSGAHTLLDERGETPTGRYLLVSLGTGTFALVVDGNRFERVGGSALGGGTLLGLGRRLLGTAEFEDLAQLAREGDRGAVDLRIADIYGDRGVEEIGIPGEVTASNLAKLARGESVAPPDLARGLMGLVGENVALIVSGLALRHGVERVVYAGSPLDGNPVLENLLIGVTRSFSLDAHVLVGGAYAGARGALSTAEESASA